MRPHGEVWREVGEGVANQRTRKSDVVLALLGAVLVPGIFLLGFAEVDAAFHTSRLQFSALVLLLPLSLLGYGALCVGLAIFLRTLDEKCVASSRPLELLEWRSRFRKFLRAIAHRRDWAGAGGSISANAA